MLETSQKTKLSLLFFSFLVLVGIDIRSDFLYGIPLIHLVTEIVLFFCCLFGFSYFADLALKQYKKQNRKLQTLQQNLQSKDQELQVLNKKISSYKEEFRAEIEKSFKDWGFTRAEAEVAGLLLKGLSIKEVAELRHSNEQTVRSQCSSIYRKSKLENRSQLSSYFLDDLV